MHSKGAPITNYRFNPKTPNGGLKDRVSGALSAQRSNCVTGRLVRRAQRRPTANSRDRRSLHLTGRAGIVETEDRMAAAEGWSELTADPKVKVEDE
jgi:hypothetical protein